MAELLLVNPRRRRKAKASRKGRKMSALQRKYFGKRRSGARKVTRHRRRSVAAAPARRRSRRRSVRVSRRYRSNPSFGGLSIGAATRSFVPTLKSGAVGATGALLNDLLMGYTKGYLPAVMTTGNAAIATRLLYAILTGMLGNMVLKGKGRDLSVGAMTVVLHDAGKAVLSGFMPSLPLGEYLSSGPAVGYSGVRRLASNAVNLNGLGRVGRVGRVGQYMSGLGRMGDTEFSNGIPCGY